MEVCTLHINDTVNLILDYLYSNATTSNYVKIRHEKVRRLTELYSLKAYEKKYQGRKYWMEI